MKKAKYLILIPCFGTVLFMIYINEKLKKTRKLGIKDYILYNGIFAFCTGVCIGVVILIVEIQRLGDWAVILIFFPLLQTFTAPAVLLFSKKAEKLLENNNQVL